jgi:hypothetical protein
MNNLFYLLLLFVCPSIGTSQSVDVVGKLKVSDMDTINSENLLVVKQQDGTLATRMLSTLPPAVDTSRSLQSDLLLTSALCNCPSLPPAMLQSLLDNGYTVQDLIDFQISIQDLVDNNIPIADLYAAGVSLTDLIAAGATVQDLLNAGVPVQDLVALGVPVQSLLDANQTPLTLYNGGVIIDSLYGKVYEGGLIFYFDINTGNGLVSAATDQGTGNPWGCYGVDISGADATAVGTGSQNTIDIEAGCTTANTAADLCANLSLNGYNDWFLPSKDELIEMFYKIGAGAPAPNNNIANFTTIFDSYYLSSSEIIPTNVWAMEYTIPQLVDRDKNFNGYVRAVRAF